MKFYGTICFSVSEETRPGYFTETITERKYYGEVSKKSVKNQSTENINDSLRINAQVSIISDEYLSEHFNNIKYIMYLGKPWKISNIDISYPRINLTLGDIYTGKLKKDGGSNGKDNI